MKKTFPYGNTKVEVSVHTQCPFCGMFNSPNVSRVTWTKCGEESNDKIALVIYTTTCCNNYFSATYKIDSERNTEFLCQYPSSKVVQLPDSISELSPRFINLYNQVASAEQQNHLELAGTGYRNSMEILIKDFAIIKLGKDPNEVCKLNLYESIKKYLPDSDLTTAANVIRILGNDYTHYKRKYENIEFETLKRYFQILLTEIENKLLLVDPVVPIKG